VTMHWIAVAAFLLMAVVVAAAFVLGGRLLGVRAANPGALRDETYECGEEPVGHARLQFHARYYVVALVFVLFDVEAALLFPWALQARAVGLPLVIPGLIFLGVLMLGWLYAVKKGALEWQ
jgi:NADH:ubiquinone oxidoreductase subunit 3 (subunit A)